MASSNPSLRSDPRPVSRDSFYDAPSSFTSTPASRPQDVTLPGFRTFDFAATSSTAPSSVNGTRLPSLAQTFGSPADTPLNRIPSFNELTAGASTASSRSFRQTPMDSDTSVQGTPLPRASRPNSVHDDDDNLKLVAQALADLKAAPSPQPGFSEPASKRPLLDVITSSHPLIASTVNRTNQAYNNSKNFSPRFKSTAEYMESYLHPLANTVQNVGRVTGVEGGVRWILGDRGQRTPAPMSGVSQDHLSPATAKRRKANDGASLAASEDGDYYERRMSMISNDTTSGLSYEDGRPPSYVASPQHASPDVAYSQPHSRERPKNMTMRFIRSTAGLSSAINNQSMHSMKYCLAMMRRANKNIEDHVSALTNLVKEYDLAEARELEAKKQAEEAGAEGRRDSIDDVDMQSVDPIPEDSATTPTSNPNLAPPTPTNATPRTRREVSERVQRLKSEVATVLNDTMGKISIYAGSVLPPRARDMVRRSLMALPKRAITAQKQQAEHEQEAIKRGELPSHRSRTRRNAQTAITLASEGLKMLLQISSVLDSTIGSAEEWCERLGKDGKGKLPAPETTSEDLVDDDVDIKPPTTAEKRPFE